MVDTNPLRADNTRIVHGTAPVSDTNRLPTKSALDQTAEPAEALTYNGDGTVNTITMVTGGNTYVRTFTWSDGLVTNKSAWVQQ